MKKRVINTLAALLVAYIVIVNIVTAFDVHIEKVHFEDSSGYVRITYCVPGELCD